MKQKKLLIITAVLLVGGFGICSSKLVAALEARAFKVNTVVSDDSVKFEVESKENLNKNVSIMIIDKDTKAIKYIDQAKLNGEKYTFSTALEEGNYESSLNISDNGVIAINTFVVAKDQTEEEIPPTEEGGQKPETPQDPTNPSKPGSGSTNTETPGNGSTSTDKPNNGSNSNSSNNGNTGNTGNSSNDSNNSQNQGNTVNKNEESNKNESNKNTDNIENEIAKDENTKTEADSKEEVESNIVEVFEESTSLSVGYMMLILIFAAGVGTVIYKNLNK